MLSITVVPCKQTRYANEHLLEEVAGLIEPDRLPLRLLPLLSQQLPQFGHLEPGVRAKSQVLLCFRAKSQVML